MHARDASISLAMLCVVACASSRTSASNGADAGIDAEDASVPEVSRVVCRSCSAELLAAKSEGIRLALQRLYAWAGADVLPAHAPLTFHLEGDALCGTADEMMQRYGYLTGFSGVDTQGKGHCCLFDVEKPNRELPFTPANARLLRDQLLPLHEAIHIWFLGRQEDFSIQDPFAKMASLLISGASVDPCVDYRVSSAPDNLIAALCDAGLTMDRLPEIFRRIAEGASDRGRALTLAEVCDIVSAVIGRDARRAFHDVGLL